jgi:hypothetical protein
LWDLDDDEDFSDNWFNNAIDLHGLLQSALHDSHDGDMYPHTSSCPHRGCRAITPACSHPYPFQSRQPRASLSRAPPSTQPAQIPQCAKPWQPPDLAPQPLRTVLLPALPFAEISCEITETSFFFSFSYFIGRTSFTLFKLVIKLNKLAPMSFKQIHYFYRSITDCAIKINVVI